MLQSSTFDAWLAWPGIVDRRAPRRSGRWSSSAAIEETGWKPAGTIVPIAYTVWSLWLVATGIVLLT